MAEPRGVNPQASYASNFSVMVSGMVRLVFIDERQATGRVAVTESIVAEVVMTHDVAMRMANDIIAILTSAPETKPVLNNGPFQPDRNV